MIKLTKHREPAVLMANGEKWLNTLKIKILAGRIPTEYEKSRYRHPQIKEVLKEETSGKCAYCESYLLHIAFGDVEHIIPKSTDIEETFKWRNLTLACDICNTYKGDATDLVDPYIDDPNNHFRFLGPMIVAIPSSSRAVLTEKRIRLNRAELMGRRSKRLDAISAQILLIINVADPLLKSVLISDLMESETADSTEFAGFSRKFIEIMIGEVRDLQNHAATSQN